MFRTTVALCCVAASLAAPIPCLSVTTISTGTISANTTWGPTGSPADTKYLVTVDVTVQSNAVLTIQPGTTVCFASGKFLKIGGATPGSLIADGTGASPII